MSMKRIILALTVAALMAVMLVATAGPAFAPDCVDGECNPIERPN